MYNRQLLVPIIVVIAVSAAFAQSQDRQGIRSEKRILVKFSAQYMSDALAGVPLLRGAVLDADSTGIHAVDEVVGKYGSASVSRPFLFYMNQADNQIVGQERWFEFRFDHPIAIDELGYQLQALPDIEAIEFVYRLSAPGRNVRASND